MNHETKPIKTEPQIVRKGWGFETIFANNELYCGKILHFYEGMKFSMHFHLQKHETWYVLQGTLMLFWIETTTGVVQEQKLLKGDAIAIPQGLPHQLLAIEDSQILEVSTTHYDTDSYRIYKGN